MKKLDLFTGGHPLKVDDLALLQDGVIDALKGVCNGLGTGNQAFILSGVVTSGLTISAGYIYFNGEVYPFDAQGIVALLLGQQLYYEVVEDVLPPSPVTYQDLSVHNVHVRRRIVLTGAFPTPPNSILASSIVRLNQILGITPQKGIIMYSGLSTNFDSNGKGKSGTQLDGWALCNGNTFTVPGGGTVVAPNLRGKFIVGFDERTSGADTDYDVIGDTGGEKTHTLTKSEIPKHKHTLASGVDGGTGSTASVTLQDSITGFGGNPVFQNGAGADLDNNISQPRTHAHALTGNTGDGTTDGLAGAAHENRPPYYTLAYIMKLI